MEDGDQGDREPRKRWETQYRVGRMLVQYVWWRKKVFAKTSCLPESFVWMDGWINEWWGEWIGEKFRIGEWTDRKLKGRKKDRKKLRERWSRKEEEEGMNGGRYGWISNKGKEEGNKKRRVNRGGRVKILWTPIRHNKEGHHCLMLVESVGSIDHKEVQHTSKWSLLCPNIKTAYCIEFSCIPANLVFGLLYTLEKIHESLGVIFIFMSSKFMTLEWSNSTCRLVLFLGWRE